MQDQVEPTETPAARSRPTMRDVAALAGVSLKTVSRVVNGEPTVNAELAARVRRASDSLGYRPDLAARNLRSSDRRTRTIGLLLEDVSNPFSSAVHRAVEDLSRPRGVAVLAGSIEEDPVRERELASALVARRVDGLIVVPAGDDQSYLRDDQAAGLQVVFADRPPQLLRADTVVSDNRGGAAAAVRHLLGVGHTRIAFLGDRSSIYTAAERRAGYEQALIEAGLPVDPDLIQMDFDGVEKSIDGVRAMLSGGAVTAVFATQNLITIGAVRALRQLGLEHEIALVGFDDFVLADLLQPAVTVVAQDPRAIGQTACEILFARMDGADDPVSVRTIPTRLIARGSGEIPPR